MKVLPFAGKLVPALAALLMAVTAGQAQEWRGTSTLFGESKYGNDFKRYDYVNPDAPKGGTINSAALGTFDSFNPFSVSGTPAAGIGSYGGLLYDTLMVQSIDEPSTSYPMIAEAFKYPDDYSSATYRINPRARWHDGTPITAEDVVWSLKTLKEVNALYNKYYANVVDAVALSDHEVEFRFDQKGNRELPHIMGDLAVLPKHWWEGTDAQGKKRDISRPTLEPPLGSGPYRIESFKPGSEIIWARVPDYWAADIGANVGRHNFDRQRYIYFGDQNAAWLAFTKGGYDDIRAENSAKRWAVDYNFPAVKDGDVIKKEFASTSPKPAQFYALNNRREQFKDRRVREALTWAFDFESMNRTVFYNSYKRTSSYFEGGELASSGIPQGKELEILEAYRDKLPPELFTQEFKLPVYTQQSTRENLKHAFELFKEAGWINRNGKLVNEKTGKQFKIEFLGDDPNDERTTNPFIENLRRLGIDASLRVVDTSQYISRVRSFDYDALALIGSAQSLSPGNEQRDFWSSAAADRPDSRNYLGIKDPIVDALIDRVIFASDRADLIAATHALDRVLLWNYYSVLQWNLPVARVGYWNKFGIPEKQPSYAGFDSESWWIDPDKEKALAAKYKGVN
ncbi:extracellular solute-binding protein [Mesorhizobium sp. CN2-181]|uniref:extracellular solute-binding protein n=1 Tax=Mesorhizobium yinganensis TaxID=3157707 RepID=UPI0032B749A2